jgi:hypothetical protein
VNSSLIQSHWLPISGSVTFKLYSITLLIHAGRGPVFLQDLVTAAATRTQDLAVDLPIQLTRHYPDCERNLASVRFSVLGLQPEIQSHLAFVKKQVLPIQKTS